MTGSVTWAAALFLTAGVASVHAFPYAYDDVSSYCDSAYYKTFTIYCPTFTWGAKAGTAEFLPRKNSCTMNFTTDGDCGAGLGYRHAIYMNIRESDLPLGASMDIYENVGSSQYLVKSISGGKTFQFHDPSSAGQLISSYKRKPSFTLKYYASTYTSTYGSIQFDYNIVFKNPNSDYSYCSALEGYVSDDLICDGYDRVNCPETYQNTTFASNAALSIQSCGLEGGAIAGVAIGTVAGVVLISVIIVLACRRSRARTRTHVHQTFTSNQHTAVPPPVMVGGGYYPQPAGAVTGQYQPPGYPAQIYSGPPPAYPSQQYATGLAPYPAGSGPQPGK